jgi:hypothetical protein
MTAANDAKPRIVVGVDGSDGLVHRDRTLQANPTRA